MAFPGRGSGRCRARGDGELRRDAVPVRARRGVTVPRSSRTGCLTSDGQPALASTGCSVLAAVAAGLWPSVAV